ncbi:protein OSB2, chloroplastic-like [Melia azedarach]|uniref:Protein OSB2, chloroplastic-like n=1 Tax=Melia azedarach TaxID=155640 RepID=A0ACC1YVA4_MELAZ|nr:protein OSB2, chloroplastic-like [Melia azedarach]
MALEQTLISTSNLVFSIPAKTFRNFQFPSLSSSLNVLSRQSWFSHQQPLKLKLKCSIDYKDYQYNQAAYSKPPEIPWSKELSNTVHLIGVVGTPVEIKHLPSGKVLAWTRLAVRKSTTDTSWINLTFWDELAQVASHHVEKGHQIYVSGRLVSDVVESDDGKQQTYYKVVVQQLNFVERSSSSVASYDHDSNFMTAGKKYGNNTGNITGSTEELWQAFFANPVDWWDNRKNKKNPKYPDFKHKDTGEALWVEGRYNPHWVKSQLALLDDRMGSLRDDDTRTRYPIPKGGLNS